MNIIITGAGKGIGFELAKKFVSMHEHTIIAISRNKKDLEKLKSTFPKNKKLITVPCNLVTDDLVKLKKELFTHVTKVDILINNAGVLINKPFELQTENDFDTMFNVNVKVPFLVSKLLLKHFTKNAHIVNIGSMGGFQGSIKFSGLSLYSASKGALAILTECMAEEFKSKNIKVNCLALGSVDTIMLQKAFPGYKAEVSPLQMADYIAEFALNGHQFVNGKVIPVSVTTP